MSVIRAAFTVGISILLTRITGFLRECTMVFCLGAGMFTDSLFIALKLSNTFRRIFAEGAFNASFLPRFSKIYHNEGQEKANNMLSDVFSFLLITLIIFCAVVLLCFPSILQLLVSGFDVLSQKFGLTVTLGRICFPYLIFVFFISLLGGVLNTAGKFALPAIIHSLLNIFIIAALLISHYLGLSHYYAVHIVAVFVILAGITQSFILYTNIKKYSFDISLKIHYWTEQVKDVVKNMIPGIIGAGVWQLNLLFDMTISSYLPTGTFTCINLADRINQFPLGTLGVALSTALLPTLSKLISQNKFEEAARETERCILFSCFLVFFACSALIALSYPSVAVAFQRGLFTAEHVRITASALVGFAIGLPAYIMTKIYSSSYFAAGDTITPVILGIVSVLINIICLILLVPFWKYFGLALCTSISAFSNALMLIIFSDKRIKININKTFVGKILSQLVAAIVIYNMLTELSDKYWTIELGENWIKWFVYCAFVIAAIIVYFAVAIIILKLTGQKSWRLWKKESW